jgi:hypothetical protein
MGFISQFWALLYSIENMVAISEALKALKFYLYFSSLNVRRQSALKPGLSFQRAYLSYVSKDFKKMTFQYYNYTTLG